MSMSNDNLHNKNFFYFLIIATCGIVHLTTALASNLAQIGPYNDHVLPETNRTCVSTKGIQLISLASSKKQPKAVQGKRKDGRATYPKLRHLLYHGPLRGSAANFYIFSGGKDFFSGWCNIYAWNSSIVPTNRAKEILKATNIFLAPAIPFVAVESNWNWDLVCLNGPLGYYTEFRVAGNLTYCKVCVAQVECPFYSLSLQVSYVSLALLCSASILLVLVFQYFIYFIVYLWKKRKPNDEENQVAQEGSALTFDSCSPRPFTLEELSQATNNFHQDRMLGMGGFGAVYKAVFTNGTYAAVKRVSNTSQQGIKEYKAEVTIVSRSNHRNLVQLIGWCHEKEGELLVVYELMENRSLDVHLFNSEMAPLAWDVRYKIAQGLAKALRYLHEECGQHCVLHMDIKSSNVLLDSNFEPKLSDFGLAKLVDHDQSMELSVLAGTRGYLAPECVLTGRVSQQSDVYSFGVVVLELATGRKTIDTNAEEDQIVLVKWVQNLYTMSRILEAVDPKLGDDYDEMQVKHLMVVGLWCVQHDFHERPSMREIVRILDDTQDPLPNLQIPSLVPDSVSQDFDFILESPRPLDLIASMEIGSPSTEFVDDTVLPKPEGHTYSPLLVWRHMSILYLLRYLVGIIWFRSSPNG